MNKKTTKTEVKSVYIPAKENHDGFCGITVRLAWVCPVCGSARGNVYNTRSYDGSRYLQCDGWKNPCGHIDKYADVLKEAAANGLNGGGK